MKKNRKMNARIFGGAALATFVAALVLAIVGMTWTMTGIRETAISRTPTAILASVGVLEEKVVSLPVMYYDQVADECVSLYDAGVRETLYSRQFEWSGCGYYNKEVEQGIVKYELGEGYLPIAVGGQLTANRGVEGDGFKRWFSEVEGKSKSYAGVLKMNYRAEDARFTFYKDEFYPLDAVDGVVNDGVNKDGHNHLFTLSFAVPFTVMASGDESFTVKADDDTFVYVGDRLVIDLGGVHEAAEGVFKIQKNGEVYSAVQGQDLAYSGVTVQEGEGTMVRIFHADRDAEDSTFNIEFVGMNLSVMNTQLADKDGNDGVQIAYDPTDSSYVAPLGETAVVQPDNSKGLIIMATIEGALVVVFAIFVVISVKAVLRRRIESN